MISNEDGKYEVCNLHSNVKSKRVKNKELFILNLFYLCFQEKSSIDYAKEVSLRMK
jgi:hypothetical protein